MSESINIKNLLIEAPIREPDFNPDRFFTEEDWKDIGEHLRSERFNSRPILLEFASQVKLISPRRFSMLNIDYLEGVKENQKDWISNETVSNYLRLAACAKQLFGKGALDLEISDEDRFDIKERIREAKEINSTYAYLDMASYFKIIFPEEPVETYITEDGWQLIKDIIKEDRDRHYWYSVAYSSAQTRLLFPKRFPELSISESDLQKIYRTLIFYYGIKEWNATIAMTWSLKILTADYLRVTDDGIELINHPKPLSESQPLPEKRRF